MADAVVLAVFGAVLIIVSFLASFAMCVKSICDVYEEKDEYDSESAAGSDGTVESNYDLEQFRRGVTQDAFIKTQVETA